MWVWKADHAVLTHCLAPALQLFNEARPKNLPVTT